MENTQVGDLFNRAKDLMHEGFYLAAIPIYEQLGMKNEIETANLKCAADCLASRRYALAADFMKKGGMGDEASELEAMCRENGIKFCLKDESRPMCSPGFHMPSSTLDISGYMQKIKEHVKNSPKMQIN